MSLVGKIRRSKDNQLERENAGRVNANDTSFYTWIKNLLGKHDLLIKRKFKEYHNSLQWNTNLDTGENYSNLVPWVGWLPLKFTEEILRGDLAKVEAIDGFSCWSFYAGITGVYHVEVVLKVTFADYANRDYYGVIFPICNLGINGIMLKAPIAWNHCFNYTTSMAEEFFFLSGSQNIYLDAGDRMNAYLNIGVGVSPSPWLFNVFGQISINFQTKQSRIILPQV